MERCLLSGELERRNVEIVFCDMPQLKYLSDGKTLSTPFWGTNSYFRLHGRNQNKNGENIYRYDYSDDELRDFVPIIQNAIAANKRVQVYFNNHPSGSGVKNGLRLKELLKNLFFETL